MAKTYLIQAKITFQDGDSDIQKSFFDGIGAEGRFGLYNVDGTYAGIIEVRTLDMTGEV